MIFLSQTDLLEESKKDFNVVVCYLLNLTDVHEVLYRNEWVVSLEISLASFVDSQPHQSQRTLIDLTLVQTTQMNNK